MTKFDKDYLKFKNWDDFAKLSTKDNLIFKKIFNKLKFNFNKKNILDFGFGNGQFLEYSKKNNAFVSGIEINKELIRVAKKKSFNVFTKIPRSKSDSGIYDLVTMFDVCEHMHNIELQQTFLKVKESLKKNGILLIRVPNCQSALGLIHQFGDPTHVNMLSGPLLEAMLIDSGYTNTRQLPAHVVMSGNNLINLLISWPINLLFRLIFCTKKVVLTPNVIVTANK